MSETNERSVASAGSLGGIRVADLSEEFETIQIIAAKGEVAEFEDGESYPVVAWALQARKMREDERWMYGDDETMPAFCTRVVGLILSEESATLVEVDSDILQGGFARYAYAK
jgi:hypothetical protein